MCVIGHIPAKKTLPRQLLENCYDNNSHGWGIMYSHASKVHYIKEVSAFSEFWKAWRDVPKEAERAVHFRIRTHGETNDVNCHPFQPTENILFMHNGIISTFLADKKMSDTWNFSENVLKPVMVAYENKGVNPISNEGFGKLVSELAGSSKLLFLDKDGNTMKVNPNVWVERMGCYFSNGHSLEKSYSSSRSSYQHYNHHYERDYGDTTGGKGWNGGYHSHTNNRNWDTTGSIVTEKNDLSLAARVERAKSNGRYDVLRQPLLLPMKGLSEIKSDLYAGNKTDEEGQQMEKEVATHRAAHGIDGSFSALQQQIQDSYAEHAQAEEVTDDEEDYLSIQEGKMIDFLLRLNPDDITNWVQENPIPAAEVIDLLLGQMVNAGLLNNPDDAETATGEEVENPILQTAVNT